MRRNRRTKILATLGPASQDDATVRRLFEAGADVFRINMSHSSHEVLNDRVKQLRRLEAEIGRPIGILADLQGPKLRVGTFANPPVMLEKGQLFTLDSDPTPGDSTRVQLPHPEILESLRVGHRVLIDDGKLIFVVVEAEPKKVVIQVEFSGPISNKKGVSLPDTILPTSALTPKDRSDLTAALEAGVDWIALSFVQRPEDVAEVKKIARGRAQVMAKLEKPQAIERLEEIMELSDALMVARGDLGVELPLEVVPGLQKRITRMARKLGKPVVVATQMLESMIVSPTPTRAEVSDVATAVFEGADAVMLSAESAAGKFVFEAVETMNKIIEAVERDPNYPVLLAGQRSPPSRPARMRSPQQRAPWRKRWISRRSSRGRPPAQRPCESPANVLIRRSLHSRPHATRPAVSRWSGVSTLWWVKIRRMWMTWPMPARMSRVSRNSPIPVSGSFWSRVCPSERRVPRTCCASRL